MHYPLEFSIGNFKLSAHLLFETLAFIIGFRYFLYLRKRNPDHISETNRVWIIIGAAFGAFLFSRLVGALEDPPQFLHSEHPLIYFYSAKTIVGGLFGGLLCVEGIKLVLHEKESSGDLFTYPLILAMIIGRIGCFTSGVYEPTYGVASSLPWAMDLGDGIKRHPVALYEIIFLLCLWMLLKKIQQSQSLKKGVLFKLFLVSYFLFRFLIDFIKPGFRYPFGLTTIQICCILGLIYYYHTVYYLIFDRAKLKTP